MDDAFIEAHRGDYTISTNPARLEVAAIHAFLTRSYWSPGIPINVVSKAIRGSLCFGLYEKNTQVGFARVVTDRAIFAYLCDYMFWKVIGGRDWASG